MKKLIHKLNKSKYSFKERKLQDLLKMFGGRRCKSMIELRADWEKEED